jgi:16S rRNA (guanine1516-N2)-methyltransferase
MYPEKKKSALPRKEMQIFKEIVGADLDCVNYLDFARTVARDRVVVKRPLTAPPIKTDTNAQYVGKTTRYDMYKIF